MNWKDCAPPSKTPTGAPASARMLKGGRTMSVFLAGRLQEECFGGSLIGEALSVSTAYREGIAYMRLLRDPAGAVRLVASVKGGCRFTIERFAACLPDDAVNSEACSVEEVEEDTGAVILRLPSFCEYSAAKSVA